MAADPARLVVELATATGDALFPRLVELAIGCDRPRRWTHDWGRRIEYVLDERTGEVRYERYLSSRCGHRVHRRGVCRGLREEVRRIRLDRWGRCWRHLHRSLEISRGLSGGEPVELYGPLRVATGARLDRQAAALAVWLLKHGHGPLSGRDWRAVADAYYGDRVAGRDLGTWSREVEIVRRLERRARQALRIWTTA